ncbi:M23 family metallopeptidase [Microbacterium sp.]|uniref:M23 family metallopeptidase n=1 Tax=Microbacterium sp. TaxID=51671 RepID=UPI0039E3D62C
MTVPRGFGRDGAPAVIDLAYPFTGRWLVQNSPANRVPSHGTHAFATARAIDFVPVTASGRTAPITPDSLVRPEPAERFPGFGRSILAPVEGVIMAVHDSAPDHPASRGLPSIRYALTQRRRAAAGWVALAGNHVLIDSGGIIVVLCHLQQGGIRVGPGQRVQVGDAIGRCGNSGNSTEPRTR